MGLTTGGYYHNFVGWLMMLKGGLISKYPEKICHVIIVCPSSIHSTSQADAQLLANALTTAGFKLETGSSADINGADEHNKLKQIWFKHVEDGIISSISPAWLTPSSTHLASIANAEGSKKSPVTPSTPNSKSALTKTMMPSLIKWKAPPASTSALMPIPSA